jgi:two-component system, chemotaxis family, protein-glutamate methylesterase/glutaminase
VNVRRVLICEDSQTYSAGLSRLLARDPELEIAGVCTSAEAAIARLPLLKPDVVTMDLELPGMSGMDAIEQIMSVLPVPILVLSGHVEGGSQNAVAALAAGALDVLPKDGLDLADPDGPAARALRQRIKLLSRVRVIRHPRGRLSKRSAPAPQRTASLIGVCASTGGPPALAHVLGPISPTFSIPILVVQHIAAGFVDGFAQWLDTQVQLPVQLATGGEKATRGIWVAPEGAHLVVDASLRFELWEEPATAHRPSADVLLTSVAQAVGRHAFAVVLTGMGKDGAEGVAAVRRAGGHAIAQDEATSAVYGMPNAAAAQGAEVVSLDDIGARIRTLRPAYAVAS